MDFYKKLIPDREFRLKLLKLLRFIPDDVMVKIQYRVKMGRKLNLKDPKRYTEKLQWFKLYYRDPIMPKCVDKYDVREYIEALGLSEILNECYGVYETVEEIDFDSLPDKFIAKDTLGGGGNRVIVCTDKAGFDLEDAKKKMKMWVSDVKPQNGGREWVYECGKKKRIVIEKLLEDPKSKDGAINDYKFFCFGGKPEYVVYDTARFTGHRRNVYDTKWNKLDVQYRYPLCEEEIPKPEGFEEMVEIAAKLSKDFPAVRVDLYNIAGKIYFGELTFFNGSGYTIYNPDSFDFELGEKFILPERNN